MCMFYLIVLDLYCHSHVILKKIHFLSYFDAIIIIMMQNMQIKNLLYDMKTVHVEETWRLESTSAGLHPCET